MDTEDAITIGTSPPRAQTRRLEHLEQLEALADAAFANEGEWVSATITTSRQVQVSDMQRSIAKRVAEVKTRENVMFVRVYERKEV